MQRVGDVMMVLYTNWGPTSVLTQFYYNFNI